MKRVILLGSSGSIGESTCKVARALPDKLKLVGLGVAKSTPRLLEQAREFGVNSLAVSDSKAAEKARLHLPQGARLFEGPEGLTRMVEETEADMVLVAIVGTAGLAPALAALRTGKDLAVASKEILVLAGSAVMGEAKKRKRQVLPVDSEHNAIFQCLQGANGKEVRKIILTASGGPFRQMPAKEMAKVTVAQALKHPTWSMGKKITIDSATMFNKGLEMIEAHWLFGLPMAQVDVVVHPQSIVHSMVEFVDGSVLAQLSVTDMCFPIQYAITYPERRPSGLPPLDLPKLGALTFEKPDEKRFPALRLAREAGEAGGTLPGVFNAANEMAVEAFLDEKIPFPKIWGLVEAVMESHQNIPRPDLPAIVAADGWARAEARKRLGGAK
ncbi:MAG: 1-deoxy-D-xylulose-5-phosphate reductoisomerase [Verrucomicrobia bacterium]|nr:1-deoxy-D-xylulose-5-phosphate reductoisomerase [Verrucomicrobiota bacterium]NDD81227.1 1-deoxy-D-xylulose-5-phosphate reductoisomerase [Verrucomicrobiota bacterium]